MIITVVLLYVSPQLILTANLVRTINGRLIRQYLIAKNLLITTVQSNVKNVKILIWISMYVSQRVMRVNTIITMYV